MEGADFPLHEIISFVTDHLKKQHLERVWIGLINILVELLML